MAKANTKQKVAAVQLQNLPKLRRMRVLVQEGVSPSDTSAVAACNKCGESDSLQLEQAAFKSGQLRPAGYAWLASLEKKHRRCGLPAATKGITQRLF